MAPIFIRASERNLNVTVCITAGGSQILVSIVTQRLNTGLKLSGYLIRETTAIGYP
jgi:hypothetical protein